MVSDYFRSHYKLCGKYQQVRTGNVTPQAKIQNQWTEDEVEDLLVLMDKLGGSLPMKKLETLQD